MLRQGASLEGYLYLINHSLQHLNIKKVNMEIWEDISLHIVKPYTELLPTPHAATAFEGLRNVCLIFFNYDMKIRELTAWLAKGIAELVATKDPNALPLVHQFNDFLAEEYSKNRHESVRFLAEELSELLETRGLKDLISVPDS